MIWTLGAIVALHGIHSTALVFGPSQATQAHLLPKDTKPFHDADAFTEVSGSVTFRMPNPPEDMPDALKGRNLVIAGDSVDRYAAEWLCKLYRGEASSFTLTQMNTDKRNRNVASSSVGRVSGDGRGGYGCHMKDFNASLLYLHHPGVMSSPPQPSWHATQNQGNPKRHARLWHSDSGATINASTDLARTYWRQAVEDTLPKRPVILLAQSSLWDSILAMESLQQGNDTHSFVLTSSFDPTVLEKWGWTQHADNFLQAVWDSGLPIEKKVWRTNANCPVVGQSAPVINMVSHAQANEARRLIQKNEGPWRDVLLMDWRKDFNATSPGWCNGIHYSQSGYLTYIQSLWDTITK